MCLLSKQVLSFLFNVESDFCISKLEPTIDQNVAQTEENHHEVGLRFPVSVVELPIESVALNGRESPEEDLPGSVLVRVDKYFDVYNDYDCCEYKVTV